MNQYEVAGGKGKPLTMKEARRIIKEEIKHQGKVIGHYSSQEITKAARELVNSACR